MKKEELIKTKEFKDWTRGMICQDVDGNELIFDVYGDGSTFIVVATANHQSYSIIRFFMMGKKLMVSVDHSNLFPNQAIYKLMTSYRD